MNGDSVTVTDARRSSVCVRVDPAGLGRVLRRLRRARDLSIEDLALRADLHPTYVSSIERGERNPSCGKLSDLALALGVPLSALMQDAELEARVMRLAQSIERSLTERGDA
ncbi:MAG TPA: helix-turn-helix transcriptional regulator [Solirubrobacteraceae bacterium]|jgi:transcriptional regulator with XRE-family HTH domain|nr:helix-turn-helix transcriptional regulator [Solirubrobacteraceae bacterium]